MSFSSPMDIKEQVRQAIDIVDLVGKHIQLRRQGRNYVGLCPWHDDTKPSFQVNPERQSFKCWVCDIGGDVFSFVMRTEGVEFREALEMLADQAGIELQPLPSKRPAAVADAPDGDHVVQHAELASGEGKRSLYRAMAWAEQQYHQFLLDEPEADHARRYLADRGITQESIEKFRVGYCPNRRSWILEQAKGGVERARILEAVGILARPAEGGDPYDRFRGRLLFSIRDTQDRPVGIGGRVLPESGLKSPAKYVNSPETVLFSKSNLLYGLDVARRALRKDRTVVVTEGYTDCIMAHQFGFDTAVAVLGTALGPRHVRMLKRFADRIVLVLDGDEAGQRRAGEVLELFVAESVDLQILTLPENSDPCDFLLQHGADAFSELLKTGAVDALEHAFQITTRGIDLEHDVHGASEALERMVSVVAKAPRLRDDSPSGSRFREERILQRLAARFRVPEGRVRERLTALRRQTRRRTAMTEPPSEAAPSTDQTAEPAGRIDPFQRELLEILLRHPECLARVREQIDPGQLSYEPCRKILAACVRLADEGLEPSFSNLMLKLDDPGIKSLLVELDETSQAKGADDLEQVLEELLRNLVLDEESRKYPEVTGALREGKLDETEQEELLRKTMQQARARHGISKPTDG